MNDLCRNMDIIIGCAQDSLPSMSKYDRYLWRDEKDRTPYDVAKWAVDLLIFHQGRLKETGLAIPRCSPVYDITETYPLTRATYSEIWIGKRTWDDRADQRCIALIYNATIATTIIAHCDDLYERFSVYLNGCNVPGRGLEMCKKIIVKSVKTANYILRLEEEVVIPPYL